MKKKINLLVLEDNPDDFFLLKEVLESYEEIDIEIFHENQLNKAITTANKTSINAAIIDLGLPDSFGLETFTSFNDHFSKIPTIILTGSKDRNLAVQAVQKGAQDYLYKGETSSTAIIRTILYAIERQRLLTKLQNALDEIKTLRGLIPICSHCKKIRDDKGYWNILEAYIQKHSEASFSHGICPDCSDALYGNEDWYIEMKNKKNNKR